MSRWILPLTLLAAIGAAAAYWVGPWSQQRLVARWEKELASLEETQLPVRMRQLSEINDQGLGIVVRSVNHERAATAHAAQRELEHQLRVWRQAQPRQASAKVLRVAKELSEVVEQMGYSTRIYAADIASQLLAWPSENDQQNAKLVSYCETVLVHARKPVDMRQPARQASPNSLQTNRDPVRGSFNTPSKLENQNLDFPGGGLPVELVRIPGVVGRMETLDDKAPIKSPASTTGRSGQPPQLLISPGAKPLTVPGQEEEKQPKKKKPGGPSLIGPLPTARRLSGQSADKTPSLSKADKLAYVPSSRQAKKLKSKPRSWGALKDVEVMKRLHDSDPLQVRAAWKELRRRGFRVVDLGLAEEVTHSNAKKRLAAVSEVALVTPEISRRFLIILSHDSDARVRREAVSLMATSQDLHLKDRLRQMQTTESDRRIRNLIRKALSQ